MRRFSPALALSLLVTTAAASVGALGVAGCKNEPTIPGTEIPDTDANREILQVLENYRMAFVARNPAAVLSLAHPTYHDEAGTDDPSDDVVYEELGQLLRRRLNQLDSIRFTMDYIDIQGAGDRATVHVWMDASFKFKPVLDSEGEPREAPRYARKQDHARFELVYENETWLITSGI